MDSGVIGARGVQHTVWCGVPYAPLWLATIILNLLSLAKFLSHDYIIAGINIRVNSMTRRLEGNKPIRGLHRRRKCDSSTGM